jgi:flagellar biosynthetic protein FlhB
VSTLSGELTTHLSTFGDHALANVTANQIDAMVISGVQLIAVLVGPIALVTMAAGVGTHGFQGGWTFSAEKIQLNWTRLNPANGVKRFGLVQSLPDTFKSLVSVAVIAWLGWGATQAIVGDSLRLAWMTPYASALVLWDHTETMFWQIGWALAFLAIGDYALQRWRLMRTLKMSKQELRQEAKENDGNPEVKGRIRRIQRDMARRRMIEDVKKATVVITNPTHFAVALDYQRGMAAPVVVAKGQDYLAQRMKAIAAAHDVPMVENVALARTLYSSVDVGETIPGPLFEAVAEVLAYLIRIKRLVL